MRSNSYVEPVLSDKSADNQSELLRQQTVLARFGELALKSDNLDDILTEACRLVGEALGTDLAKVMELQADGITLFVRAGVGWKPDVVGKVTVEASEDSSEGHALRTGKPMISPDIQTETRFHYPGFLTDNGVKAIANVVIIGSKDRPPFGILQIDSRTPREFNDSDTTFLSGYANLIAAAVDRLRTIGEALAREGQLRESMDRQQAALETGFIGFFEWDVPSGAIFGDRHVASFFGLDQGILKAGVPFADLMALIHPDDRAPVSAVIERSIASAGDYENGFRIVHPSSATRWIQMRAHCTKRRGERPLFYTGTAVDVTVSKMAEAALREMNETLEARVTDRTRQLVEANIKLRAEAEERERVEDALRQSVKMEAIGQLTGGVAHDFNNLLTVIRSSVDLLKRPNLSEERRTRYIAAISDTVERAAKLTGQLLAFARRQALKPEIFAACDAVRMLSGMLGTLTGSRIKVTTELPETPCFVNADPSQFDTALVNIAVNARDAMNGEGRLTIQVKNADEIPVVRLQGASPGAFVAVSIADTGSGIPTDRLEQIFEPFYTTKEQGKGTGLGLSQVFGFAKQSGGEVIVESQIGEGSTFTIFLPRVAAPEKRPVEAAQLAPLMDGHGTRVLVVEDNTNVGTFATQTLAELGYQTVWASSAEEALSELAKGAKRFDVVFSDVVMPGMSGIELGQRIRQDHRDLPVVLTSGYSHVLAQNGTYGFELLYKPYSIEQLSRVLRKVAKSKR